MKLSIKDLNGYVKDRMRKEILGAYRKFEILSEADLEAFVWERLRRFLRLRKANDCRVNCRLALKTDEMGVIHPDIVVTKKSKPWVVFELKEARRRIKDITAKRERERLLACKNTFRAKRGYLLYVCRNENADGKSRA